MYHIFFIHSSVDRYLGCFHVLAILNSATMNIWVHISFWIIVFSRYMPGVGLLDHMATLFLVFWGTSILFFHSGCTNLHSPGKFLIAYVACICGSNPILFLLDSAAQDTRFIQLTSPNNHCYNIPSKLPLPKRPDATPERPGLSERPAPGLEQREVGEIKMEPWITTLRDNLLLNVFNKPWLPSYRLQAGSVAGAGDTQQKRTGACCRGACSVMEMGQTPWQPRGTH